MTTWVDTSMQNAVDLKRLMPWIAIAMHNRSQTETKGLRDELHQRSGSWRNLCLMRMSSQSLRKSLGLMGSWFDGLIVEAAIRSRRTVLFSEDFGHGRQFGQLTGCNPFASGSN